MDAFFYYTVCGEKGEKSCLLISSAFPAEELSRLSLTMGYSNLVSNAAF